MPKLIPFEDPMMKLRLRYVASVYYRKYQFTIFRDEKRGVQLELRLKWGQGNIEPRRRYWVDSHPTPFKTEKDVLSFLASVKT